MSRVPMNRTVYLRRLLCDAIVTASSMLIFLRVHLQQAVNVSQLPVQRDVLRSISNVFLGS